MADSRIRAHFLRLSRDWYTRHQGLCRKDSARNGQFQEKEKNHRLLSWIFFFEKNISMKNNKNLVFGLSSVQITEVQLVYELWITEHEPIMIIHHQFYMFVWRVREKTI